MKLKRLVLFLLALMLVSCTAIFGPEPTPTEDFMAEMVEQHECQQSRYPPVAVAEGMDAKEVEDGERNDEQRLLCILVDRRTIGCRQLLHGLGRCDGADGPEANPRHGTVGQALDDLVIRLLP